MDKSMRLWFEFARSGKLTDYLRYTEAKRAKSALGYLDDAPSEAVTSIEGISKLPEGR